MYLYDISLLFSSFSSSMSQFHTASSSFFYKSSINCVLNLYISVLIVVSSCLILILSLLLFYICRLRKVFKSVPSFPNCVSPFPTINTIVGLSSHEKHKSCSHSMLTYGFMILSNNLSLFFSPPTHHTLV